MTTSIENPPTYTESIQNENYNEIPIPQVITNLPEERMTKSYNLASTIKCITIIEIIFCLINFIYFTQAIVLVIFPLIGYYGANNYNRYLTLVYGFYNLLFIFFRIYAFSYMTVQVFEKMFLIFAIIVSLFIIKITQKFFRILGELTDEELQELKLGFIPVNIRYIWY